MISCRPLELMANAGAEYMVTQVRILSRPIILWARATATWLNLSPIFVAISKWGECRKDYILNRAWWSRKLQRCVTPRSIVFSILSPRFSFDYATNADGTTCLERTRFRVRVPVAPITWGHSSRVEHGFHQSLVNALNAPGNFFSLILLVNTQLD
jgi:hypothetical protein